MRRHWCFCPSSIFLLEIGFEQHHSLTIHMRGSYFDRHRGYCRQKHWYRPTSGCSSCLVGMRHGCPISWHRETHCRQEIERRSSARCCWDTSADLATAVEQATLFISDCYGFQSNSMTDCRIQSWYQKTSKARKTAPLLQTLPPTDEAFKENVKRAILQIRQWYATMEPNPPDVNLYGRLKDTVNRILVAVSLPEGVSPAPDEILNMLKCGCSSTSPCSTKRCSCSSAQVSCSILCKCRGDPDLCHNKETRHAAYLLT